MYGHINIKNHTNDSRTHNYQKSY